MTAVKLRDPLHWMPVGPKLTLMFVSVCLLAFGVGGYLVSGTAKGALRNEILTRLEFQSRAYATALEGRLRTLTRRAEDFASDGFIRDHVEALLGECTQEERAHLLHDLREHLLVNKLPLEVSFIDLGLVSPAGELLLAARTQPPPARLAELTAALSPRRPWFSGLLPGREAPERPELAIATPLTSRTGGEPLGHLVAWIHPGVWVVGAMRATGLITDRAQDQVGLMLVDSAGRRLEIDPLLTSREGPRAESEVVLSGFGLTIAEGEERSPSIEPQRDTFARSFPIATNGWSVLVELPADGAMQALRHLQSRFLGVGLILTSIASLLLFFPIRFLARPLLRMAEATRRLQEGDFSARVQVDSSDEIGELARSFNTMAEAVEERTHRLEETARDLREQRAAAAFERDRLRAVITSMHDGLVVIDAEGRPVLHNRAARPLLSQLTAALPDLRSRHICERSSDNPNCAECLREADAPPRACLLEIGSGVFEVHSTQLSADPRGRSAGHVLVCRDLTDRIAHDEQQIHQERLAVLGEVAAVMAHELNNPLAAISMYNQMTAAELEPGSDLAENTAVIQRNVQSCKRAIRELLDYATDATPEIVQFDLRAILEDVATFLRPLRERSGVHLDMRLPEEELLINGDEVQVRQIFVNLQVNAIQAMGPSGGRIEIRAGASGAHAFVDITDEGPGVPVELREDIFRPFFTTKARGEGTGLGLPTSRRIAEMQGGGLELCDSSPRGTTFRVRLLCVQEVAHA